LKQLVLLLNYILVSIDQFLADQGLGPDWTWGLAIIGVTIVVRLILFPLTWKQFSSAQAMQAIQPKIKELQRKHKADRNKLQQETMKLYSEHRVNPFASCLPLILQLPVFIALYFAIRGTSYLDAQTTQELAEAGFLWIRSVARGGDGLGYPDPTYILLILYVVTQMISTELMLVTQSDKTQKMIMRSMPIVFVFFLWSFPAGLFIYWVTTNLWSIGQQLLIRKVMKPFDAEHAKSQPAKRSRFMDAIVNAGDKTNKASDEIADKKAIEERRKRSEKQRGGTDASGTPKGTQKPGARPQSGPKAGQKRPPSQQKQGPPQTSQTSKPGDEGVKPTNDDGPVAEKAGTDGNEKQPGPKPAGQPGARKSKRRPPPGKGKSGQPKPPAQAADPETSTNGPTES
jgi:YidC/Oxa1 family membrane protein insertase